MSKIVPDIWKYAYNLRALGANKFTITFPNEDLANKLVEKLCVKDNDKFTEAQWIAYIPDYRISSKVITWDVDASETIEEIYQCLSPPPGWKGAWPELIDVKLIFK